MPRIAERRFPPPWTVEELAKGQRLQRLSCGHVWDTLVRNMPPACVCSAGGGNGKVNWNTTSRYDSGLCPDLGGVHGNPRPLKNANVPI